MALVKRILTRQLLRYWFSRTLQREHVHLVLLLKLIHVLFVQGFLSSNLDHQTNVLVVGNQLMNISESFL